MEKITRRSLFVGAASALICAPAIVRVASLMPVKIMRPSVTMPYLGYATLKEEGAPVQFDNEGWMIVPAADGHGIVVRLSSNHRSVEVRGRAHYVA